MKSRALGKEAHAANHGLRMAQHELEMARSALRGVDTEGGIKMNPQFLHQFNGKCSKFIWQGLVWWTQARLCWKSATSTVSRLLSIC